MKKDHRKRIPIYIAVFLCCISVLISGCASEKIPCPVFLEHYYELALYEEGSAFELSYVTQKDYAGKPVEAELPGLSEAGLAVGELRPMSAADCGAYAVQTVRIGIKRESAGPKEPIILDTARIRMDDDTWVEGTVGKIVLFPAKEESGHEMVPRSMLNSSSSDSSSACDLRFLEDASIVAMSLSLAEETDGILSTYYNRIPDGLDLRPESAEDSSFPERVEELGEITDDSVELTAAKLPMAFSRGDHIMMVNVIRIGNDDGRKYCRYQIERRFLLENESGETESFTALAVDAAPSLSQWELERWYKSRASADGS